MPISILPQDQDGQEIYNAISLFFPILRLEIFSVNAMLKKKKVFRCLITDHICDDPPVIEIKDRAKIYFMLVLILIIPFKFGDICQPFFVRLISCEFPVQDVLSNELRIGCLAGASTIRVLDRGFDPFLPTDPKYTFIVCLDSMITFQIIPYSAVALIRTGHMDLFNLLSDSFVFCFISRDASAKPFVVCSTAYMPQFAERSDRITMFFVFFFDRLIDLPVPDQAQPRLLSISSSFFKKDASISARSFSARRILFSARSFSNSDISSTGFNLPRRS